MASVTVVNAVSVAVSVVIASVLRSQRCLCPAHSARFSRDFGNGFWGVFGSPEPSSGIYTNHGSSTVGACEPDLKDTVVGCLRFGVLELFS